MGFQRGIDGAEPIREGSAERAGTRQQLLRPSRSSHLGVGTLACPRCDAPVTLRRSPSEPADALACAFCDHAGAVRDFLSLTAPTRPARVALRVVERARG